MSLFGVTLVRIFSIFSPNAGKYCLEKLRIRSLFTQWWSLILNPFHASISFLYPLKTSEKLWFSNVFRGYRNETLTRNGFKIRDHHCVKRLRIRSFSGAYFSVFGLNTKRYSASLCIQSEWENMDQNNFEYGHFSRSELFWSECEAVRPLLEGGACLWPSANLKKYSM